jgi:hypothetical protein
MQDDIEDWKKESALMTSVYGNSTINVAATSAADGSVGCFFSRVPYWRYHIRTTLQGKDVVFEG